MEYAGYFDRVATSGWFDADWYLRTYPGVGIVGEDPLQNFMEVGLFLNRWPGPHFDPVYYCETYRDVDGNDPPPFIHFLDTGAAEGRPATLAQARAQLETAIAPFAPRRETAPIISYCTPVMDRLDDLKAALGANLSGHRDFVGQVEFVVALFGNDDGAAEYLSQTHPDEIASGLLRVALRPRLESWHFCVAKNVFKELDIGQVYSSLDGDNFVDPDETSNLLALRAQHGDAFIVHHFTGDWGDGTCGRVSLPTGLYRMVGYDTDLLPRQYDEIDMILSTLRRFPALPVICPDPAESALVKSAKSRDFMADAGIVNPIVGGQMAPTRKPANPKSVTYVREDPLLQSMIDVNRAISFQKNGPGSAATVRALEQAMTSRHVICEETAPDRLMAYLLDPAPGQGQPRIAPDAVVLCCCLKDESVFFPHFLDHYRDLGVTTFLFVDDHSSRPLGRDIAGDDVFVFTPKVGTFQVCKILWIEALLKAYVPEGTWVVTVDADEVLDLPGGDGDIGTVARRLDADGQSFAPGLLIDMLPAADLDPSAEDLADGRLIARFDRVCDQDTPCSEAYAAHHAVAWGFGAQADLSWRYDARHHAFGTVDSLRKLPLVRYRQGLRLNQGFHTLTDRSGSGPDAATVWSVRPILPIRHYKFAKWLADWDTAGRGRVAGVYHARTAANLADIRATGPDGVLAALRSLPSRVYDRAEINARNPADPATATAQTKPPSGQHLPQERRDDGP